MSLVRVVCYVKPHRIEAVKSAIAPLGAGGMTVTDVRGTGNNASVGGSATLPGLMTIPIRSKIEVVCEVELQEAIVSAILETAQTGEPDDGKIFIEPVSETIRVRTGERGV